MLCVCVCACVCARVCVCVCVRVCVCMCVFGRCTDDNAREEDNTESGYVPTFQLSQCNAITVRYLAISSATTTLSSSPQHLEQYGIAQ